VQLVDAPTPLLEDALALLLEDAPTPLKDAEAASSWMRRRRCWRTRDLHRHVGWLRSFFGGGAIFLALHEDAPASVLRKGERPQSSKTMYGGAFSRCRPLNRRGQCRPLNRRGAGDEEATVDDTQTLAEG
jgi:hypothetical protein